MRRDTDAKGRGLRAALYARFGERVGGALYSLVASALALGICGALAYVFWQPLMFPSLGPTAYLFFELPLSENASPRNTIIGHLTGIIAGVFSLGLFGVYGEPSILQAGPTAAHMASGALSVALTGGALVLLRASHPPAGATTLIVSLGLLQMPEELVEIMAGAALLTGVGWTINRLAGVPVPLWSAGAKGRKG